MNTKFLASALFAVAAASAGSAFAADAAFGENYPGPMPMQLSTLSRSAVQAETRQAVAAGVLHFGEQGLEQGSRGTAPSLSRAEVRADTALAVKRGSLHFGESV
jgi:hypothetical protein